MRTGIQHIQGFIVCSGNIYRTFIRPATIGIKIGPFFSLPRLVGDKSWGQVPVGDWQLTIKYSPYSLDLYISQLQSQKYNSRAKYRQEIYMKFPITSNKHNMGKTYWWPQWLKKFNQRYEEKIGLLTWDIVMAGPKQPQEKVAERIF